MSDGENSNDHETTEELIEGTRQAREGAEQALEEAHEEAEELQETLESQGLVPPTGDDA
jgi:hypothetical protein